MPLEHSFTCHFYPFLSQFLLRHLWFICQWSSFSPVYFPEYSSFRSPLWWRSCCSSFSSSYSSSAWLLHHRLSPVTPPLHLRSGCRWSAEASRSLATQGGGPWQETGVRNSELKTKWRLFTLTYRFTWMFHGTSFLQYSVCMSPESDMSYFDWIWGINTFRSPDWLIPQHVCMHSTCLHGAWLESHIQNPELRRLRWWIGELSTSLSSDEWISCHPSLARNRELNNMISGYNLKQSQKTMKSVFKSEYRLNWSLLEGWANLQIVDRI